MHQQPFNELTDSMLNNQKIELEFIKGNDQWIERRVFECAEVIFVADKYLHIRSKMDGEFYMDLNIGKLLWFSSERMPKPETSEVDAEVKRLLAAGHIILAIKHVRERLDIGLKEAKEYVDKIRDGGN